MLWKRIASGVVAAPLFLLIVFSGSPLFNILVLAIAGVMAWEFTRMDGEEGAKRRALIAASCVGSVIAISLGTPAIAWAIVLVSTIAVVIADQLAGRRGFSLVQGAVPYVSIPAISLLFVRTSGGWESAYWLLAVVWMTDIGAYAFGRMIGGPKLAPAISPNKTWAGAVGGLITGTLCGLAMLDFAGINVTMSFVIYSSALSVLTQIGDLFESGLKRIFHVKDSGGLIPGHGGVMDRFDGLWAAAPMAAMLCFVFAGGVRSW